MKKILGLTLALSMLCIVMTACGQKPMPEDTAVVAESAQSDSTDKSEELTAESILKKLKESGLPITSEIVYDDKTDPNGSGEHDYIGKANFSDESLTDGGTANEPLGGTIEVFADAQEAAARAEALRGEFITFKAFGYQVLGENFLLRLNAQFSNDYAEKYAQASGGVIIKKPDNSEIEFAENMAAGINGTASESGKPSVVEEKKTQETTGALTVGQKNALASAKSYLDYAAFSYSGLIGQLEYEKYSTEDATYAADNCGADWNEQAAKSAESYLEYSSFSSGSLKDQLEYEGFTSEQAAYGVKAVGY